MLRPHVAKEHKSKVALVCHLLGRDGSSCDWICGKSMRCLASHRRDRDVHNFVAFHGKGLNLDGRAKVIVASSPSPQYTELAGRKNHTSECVKATDALVKYTARTKKRETRANAKLEREAKSKPDLAVVTINLTLTAVRPRNTVAKKQSKPVVKSVPVAATEVAVETESDEEEDYVNFDELCDSDNDGEKEWYDSDEDGDNDEVEVIFPSIELELPAAPVQPIVPIEEVVLPPRIVSHITHAPLVQESQTVSVIMGKRKAGESFSDQTPKRVKKNVVPANIPGPVPRKKVKEEPTITFNDAVAGASNSSVAPGLETSPRPKLMVKASLRGKLQQMRINGFERSDYEDLVREYSTVKALEEVAGYNDTDQFNLMEHVGDKVCAILQSQTFRYARENPEIH